MIKLSTILGVMLSVVLGTAAPACAEWFADFYSGAVFWVDPTIHVDVGNGAISGNRGRSVADFTIGGRFGYWLRPVPWLGFALDTSYYQLHADAKSPSAPIQEAKLQIVPITPLVMARLPLLESSEYPTGRLQPYLGAGPGIFWHRRKFDLQSGDRTDDDTVDVGADVRAGVSPRTGGSSPSTGSTTSRRPPTATSKRSTFTRTPTSTSTPPSPGFASAGGRAAASTTARAASARLAAGRWRSGSSPKRDCTSRGSGRSRRKPTARTHPSW